MIVDITGFGWSGSGAFLDLLKEYDDFQYPKGDNEWECSILHSVDGIKDLQYKIQIKHCRIYDSEIAVRRFLKHASFLNRQKGYKKMFDGDFYNLCLNYIKSIEGKTIYSHSAYDECYFNMFQKTIYLYNRIINKLLNNNFVARKLLPYDFSDKFKINGIHNKRVLYDSNNFIESTHQFINTLLNYVRDNSKKPLVMNHFCSPDCPDLFFDLVGEQIKCLVVRRDPRDTYLLGKILRGNTSLPCQNVEDFIYFYKRTIENTVVTHPNVLNLQFENLIYDYDETIKRIEEFLDIHNHKRPFSFFKPEISINNTQLSLVSTK